MIMKGQKRKLPPDEAEVSSAAWESQRQLVFYISLSKYQRGQELPEPSLRRSVMIANTLRRISLEVSKAPPVNTGVSPSLCGPASTLQTERESTFPRMAPPNCHQAVPVGNSHLAGAGLPSATPHHQSVASSCASNRSPVGCLSVASNSPPHMEEEEDDDWGSMSTDPDFSLSAAITSILTALDSTIDGSPQAAQRTPLRSLENLAGPEGDAAGAKQGVKGHWGGWERQEECRVVESSVEVMRSSYLGDLAVDDLFQDIDTSLLERDMGALGVRGGGGGHPAGDDLLRYLPPFSSSHPFSLSLNQNLKCLPSFSSFSPSSSSSSSPPPSSSPMSAHSHMREGLELEHLMEILVES
ncbi:SERTA domain-containing protein 3 [Diretmus argenteus]